MNKSNIIMLVVAVAAGLLITFVSFFYDHITQKEHCSDTPAIDNVIDCTLQLDNMGLPFAYVVTDLPNDDFRVPAFVADVAIWSVVSGALLYSVRRLKT